MSRPDPPESVAGRAEARLDLVRGSRLLERLSPLISVHFPEQPAKARVVVAAPHHAPGHTPVSSGHDVETGPVARDLAHALGGKCVIAHELRTFVDLNKSPLEQQALVRHLGRLSFRDADRALKLYYQSQLFESNPSTVIEIHGHVRGHYDIEISAGCTLDETVAQDRALEVALQALKDTLIRELHDAPAFEDGPPTVGVYPLDRDVKFAATGTHTFNKVEKLRELGVSVSGLHIELGPQLRLDLSEREHREPHNQLVACLARAVDEFMQHADREQVFDFKEHLLGEYVFDTKDISALGAEGFALAPLPKEQVGRRVAALSPRDMKRFGVSEGETILVAVDQAFERSVEVRAVAVDKVHAGALGVAKNVRDKLGKRPGDVVFAGRRPPGTTENLVLGYITSISSDCASDVAQVGSAIAEDLARRKVEGVQVALRSAAREVRGLSLLPSAELAHARAVGISVAVARRLDATFGDVVCFVPE